MEVTNKNFNDVLAEVLVNIDKCDFLAIDTEFTGLSGTDDKDNFFETVEERYHVIRKSASQFLVIQFGLCPFFYHPETDSYTYKVYNFYTFPRPFGKNAPNLRFLCESSSLDFLATSGFDFNKLIYEGISFLTSANEKKMREDFESREAYLSSEDNNTPLQVPENQKKFMMETQTKIKRFVKSSLTELIMENLSGFQRKLIFHNIKPNYTNVLYFETIVVKEDDGSSVSESEKSDSDSVLSNRHSTFVKPADKDKGSQPNSKGKDTKTLPNRENHNRVLKIVKLDESEQKFKVLEKRRLEMDMISEGVGFSKVIRKISESGKVVVGHNMLLDLTHTIHQFVDDLPDNLAEFKLLVQSTFPNLIDTKLMSATHPFRELIPSTVLFDLVKKVQEEPFSLPRIQKASPEDIGYGLADKKKHEAGFDAFITGACFIGMCQYLGTLQTPIKPRVLADSPLVLPFLNKLFLMRMLDITYLNISGTDLTPSRSHVFFVTCPKDANTRNIQKIFSPFGTVQMWWQNQTALFVSLNDKEQSSLVMRNIGDCGSQYKVIPFEQYQKIQAEKKRPLLSESPDRSKEEDDTTKILPPSGGSVSPPNNNGQKKKRPKTDALGGKPAPAITAVFQQRSTWE